VTPILDGSDDGVFHEENEYPHEDHVHTCTFQEEVTFPTEWRHIDIILDVECRQVNVDTFELRSASHTLTISRVGFDLYRDSTIAGQVIFENWLDKNGILPVPREDKQPTIELPEATNES
jgi:hypothetical protein